ncbi:MAG: AAA family ATPase [Desulfatitalea sp.]
MEAIRMAWSLSDPPERAAPNQSDRIYTEFFGLNGTPFSITPDPEFLFLSDTHQSVIEKIQYGLRGRMGFLLLTGEVGTGKTTLCRALLDQIQMSARTVYVINPSLNGRELLACILEDLGVICPPEASKKELIDQLNRFLLAHQGAGPVVIIIDDAQTMPSETLEDLRLLSNLETDKAKLLQMLLVGQPELLAQLDQPEMRQLKQRVAVHCLLDFLTRDEVAGYIARRLAVAGNLGQVRFDAKAVRRIHKQSGGVPRMINKICDLALTAAYAGNSHTVTARHVTAAYEELVEATSRRPGVLHRTVRRRATPRRALLAAAGLVLGLVCGFGAYSYWASPAARPMVTSAQTAPAMAPLATATAPEWPNPEIPAPAPGAGAYILQLGSYNTLASTLRAIEIYSQKGIPVNWSTLDLGAKGVWYRVFSGRHATVQEARRYQQEKGLTAARILLAPWAVALGLADSAAVIQPRIQPHGLDSYPVAAGDGRDLLYSGAFVSREGAEALAKLIEQQTGLTVEVADCASPRAALPSGGLTEEKGGPRS